MSDAARAIVKGQLERSLVADGLVGSERLLSYRAKCRHSASLLTSAISDLNYGAPTTAVTKIKVALQLAEEAAAERDQALGIGRDAKGKAR